MKCPKCGKLLHRYYSRKTGEWFWTHLFTLDVILGDKPSCDYNIRIPDKEGINPKNK